MDNRFENRIRLLQQYIVERRWDAFFVPRGDRYQSEYVVEADERLAWLTGFTGSAGIAVVLPNEIILLVDGRYTLQARQQVPSIVKVIHTGEMSLFACLEINLLPKAVIAYDSWLHTLQEQQQWHKKSSAFGWVFQEIEKNPIDQLWKDKPARPLGNVFFLEERFTGRTAVEKINNIVLSLKKTGADLTYFGSPDSICWLLNMRGNDFPYSPLIDGIAFLDCFGIITLVMDPVKMPVVLQQQLKENIVIIPETQLVNFLETKKEQKILLNAASTPIWIGNHFAKEKIIYGEDLCLLPKACKNPVEQSGMRQAHIKDGLAMVRFLSWLEQNKVLITELDVVEKLESFRKLDGNYRGSSFSTIAGYGSNGAIVHYRPEAKTNKLLEKGSLLLLDSGGQYLEGTTDITRTIAIGIPDPEQQKFFTLVLKGHIALARIQFPSGTCGRQLDALARQPLWEEGVDFDHGTGHGVGCFLNVHEVPQRISKYGSDVSLRPGMILSNEPGYYKVGAYGIRIENLMLVKKADLATAFYCFETLTLAPIDTQLIISEWLTASEREWLNNYHQAICDNLLPLLEPETAAWLLNATKPV